MIDSTLGHILAEIKPNRRQLTLLTGAGVSAESGIPTFRGADGYWAIGSKNYQPRQMGTMAMFQRQPREVWRWYLYRRGVCREARPNAGHAAIAQMEGLLPDCFNLITQNVDGLHLRAGNTAAHTCQVHGNLNFMRCAQECGSRVYPIGDDIPGLGRQEDLSEQQWRQFTCPQCGGWLRPHVLWWDESYNETCYRFHTALDIARRTDVLIVVGTTGSTLLPGLVVEEVRNRNQVLVVIDIEANAFSRTALSYPKGFFVQAPSAAVLPAIRDHIHLNHVEPNHGKGKT